MIFSVTGFLAHLTGKTISEVGASGKEEYHFLMLYV